LQPTPTLDFVYFDAGGGHRNAAMALQAVIASGKYAFKVRLVNLQELLDPLDIFRKITRIRLEDIYNLLLAKGWTLGSSQLLPLMQAVIRIYHPATPQYGCIFCAEFQSGAVRKFTSSSSRCSARDHIDRSG
jgi:hypothetical protein